MIFSCIESRNLDKLAVICGALWEEIQYDHYQYGDIQMVDLK